MAASLAERVQIVGTTALPIAMGATGGAADVWTWNHNRLQRAASVMVLQATGRGVVTMTAGAAAGLGIFVTQPTTSQMVVTNTSAVAVDIVLRVEWNVPSDDLGAAVAAAAGTLS